MQSAAYFFYKQRVRQLKNFDSGSSNLFDVDEEVGKLIHATKNAVDTRICDQLVTEVHRQLLEVVTLHLGDKDKITNETKRLYNQLGKAVPELVLKIHEGSLSVV